MRRRRRASSTPSACARWAGCPKAPQFEDVVVKAGTDGALVRVKDVGRVELGAETYSSNLRFLGLEAQGIGISLLPSANAIEVFHGVVAEMERLKPNFPPGLEWQVAFDNVVVVRESIREVLMTLLEAIGLVILVMFLFLQNWRSTIIPAITIPVSLIGTFAFIKLFDFSINTLTLFGIVLATGIVVDDAIVVIENIERHMRELQQERAAGGHRRDARGVRRRGRDRHRAGGGVRAGGVLPRRDRPPVSAVLADDRVLGRAVGVQRRHADAGARGAAARQGDPRARPLLHAASIASSMPAPTCTCGMVRGAVRLRVVMIAVFAGGLCGDVGVFQMVPSSFVPQEDEGYFMCIVQAPAGASLEYTTEIAKKAEQIIYADKDVAAAFAVMGFSFTGAAPNNGHDLRRG